MASPHPADDSAAASDQSSPGHGKRWLLILTIFLVLPALGFVLWMQDAPQPDDAWLRPNWTSAEDGENNPLAQLQAFLIAHPLPKDDKRFRMAGTQEPWNAAEAQALLTKYAGHLREIDKLLSSNPKKWHWCEGAVLARYDAKLDYLNSIQYLGQLAVIRSKAASTVQEAMQRSIEAARFGENVSSAQGGALHCMAGTTIQQQAFNALKLAMTRQDSTVSNLEEASTLLSRVTVRPQNLASALRVEYEAYRRLVEDAAAGRLGALPIGNPSFLTRVPWLTKPNHALGLHHSSVGPIIRTLDAGWQGLGPVLNDSKAFMVEFSAHRLSRVATYGGGGMLFYMTQGSADALATSMTNTEAQRILLLTQIGLRRQELAVGSLPATLAEVSPTLLDPTLRDPWSDAPVIWKKDSLRLYSVGRNGVDDGGNFAHRLPQKVLDMGDSYGWVKP